MAKKLMFAGPIVPSLYVHISLGQMVKELRSELMAYGPLMKGMPHQRDCARAIEALDQLKSSMDDLACRLVPAARDPHKLTTRIYYGKQLTDDELNAVRDLAERVHGW